MWISKCAAVFNLLKPERNSEKWLILKKWVIKSSGLTEIMRDNHYLSLTNYHYCPTDLSWGRKKTHQKDVGN